MNPQPIKQSGSLCESCNDGDQQILNHSWLLCIRNFSRPFVNPVTALLKLDKHTENCTYVQIQMAKCVAPSLAEDENN